TPTLTTNGPTAETTSRAAASSTPRRDSARTRPMASTPSSSAARASSGLVSPPTFTFTGRPRPPIRSTSPAWARLRRRPPDPTSIGSAPRPSEGVLHVADHGSRAVARDEHGVEARGRVGPPELEGEEAGGRTAHPPQLGRRQRLARAAVVGRAPLAHLDEDHGAVRRPADEVDLPAPQAVVPPQHLVAPAHEGALGGLRGPVPRGGRGGSGRGTVGPRPRRHSAGQRGTTSTRFASAHSPS